MLNRLEKIFLALLIFPRIRTRFCKLRWLLLKKQLKFYEKPTTGVGEEVIEYNLTAFNHDAAFGCGGRMDLLLYPLAVLASKNAKILIIGPRTEDDIYLAKALGFSEPEGFDLFSYSPHIRLGDMHNPPYRDAEFDAVILGWVMAYSSDQSRAAEQCKRILKPGGFLAIGWEWVSNTANGWDWASNMELDNPIKKEIDVRHANEVKDIVSLFNYPIVYINSPEIITNHHKSIIFKKPSVNNLN